MTEQDLRAAISQGLAPQTPVNGGLKPYIPATKNTKPQPVMTGLRQMARTALRQGGDFAQGFTGPVNIPDTASSAQQIGNAVAYSPGDPVGVGMHMVGDIAHAVPMAAHALGASHVLPMAMGAINMGEKAVQDAKPIEQVANAGLSDANVSVIRKANDVNRHTYEGRGGTWYMNHDNDNLIKTSVGIGGENTYHSALQMKNPLVIPQSDLSEGTFNVINRGYENFIPRQYADAADSLYRTVVHADNMLSPDEVDLQIMNHLYDAGIPEKQARGVLNIHGSNKFDAALDLIIGKGLKESGYDGLVIDDNSAKHYFNLDPKNDASYGNSVAQPSAPLKTQLKSLARKAQQ